MSDQLSPLRNFRPPLWARILGWYSARQRLKADLRKESLVAVVRQWTWWTDDEKWDHQAYFCYRRGDGHRHYEHHASNALLERSERRSKVYLFVVKAWVAGAVDDTTLHRWATGTQNQPATIPA